MKTALVVAAASMLALTAQAVGAAGYTFFTIDPPSPFLTASASGINEAGVIAGEWTDLGNITHGFIEQGGVFVSFDAPGTDNGRVLGVAGTQALGINNAGIIVGDYTAGGTTHGFIRDTSGQFTTLDLPGQVDTALVGINDNGVVAIQVDYGSAAQYGSFLRAPNGTLTSIAFPGTLATGITALNNAGSTAGGYLDAASVVHGWIRNASGVYTTLYDPAYDLVGPWGLNDAGFAVGELDFAGGSHGFVRDPQGNLAAFDVPSAAFTIATDIDGLGHIVGEYCGAHGDCHGFLATPSVPEPGRLALVLAGLGVVGLRARRGGRDRST